MKKFVRKLPIVVTIAGVVAALAYGFREVPVEVDIVSVERGSFDITINDDGVTRIREKYVVSAPVAGKLHRIELHPGDEVESGETVLARLDPADPTLLDARAEAQAEARVRSATASGELATARLGRSQEALKLAQQNLSRAKALYSKKAAPRSDLDRAQQEFEMSQADVRSARFLVKVSNFETEIAQAALIRARASGERELAPGESLGDMMAALSIKSPISGRVLRVFNEDAGVVSEGTRLLELGDPRDLEMQIDVLSSEAVRIRPGCKVFVDHWGGEGSLEGTVRMVEPSAFIKVSALGVEEHRVNVIADFRGLLDGCQSLGDGFRIETRIVVDSVSNELLVPAGVLFRQGEGWAAFRITGGRARLCRVKIGRTNGQETVVVEGLNQGDQLVLHPTESVQDLTRVIASEQ